VRGLGKGTDDPTIITYCREQQRIWVTMDWAAGTVDERVRQLTEEKVSVWWLRPEKRVQMRRPELLYAVARDIEIVAFAQETESQPMYVTTSVGSRVRHIQIPYEKRRFGPALAGPPKPRRPRTIKHGIKLFDD
jgi:hypothetical protein